MAEWGSYLKKAVANVEQQLDKVLLEQNDQKPSQAQRPRIGRPDLSERLKLAAQGKSSAAKKDEQVTKPEEDDQTKKEDTVTENNTTEETRESKENDDKPTEDTETKEVVELITTTSFENAPDMSTVLLDARRLALAVQRDDALALVDQLEATDAQLGKYVDNVTQRLQSLHSKVRILSTQRADSTNDSLERQMALLMEEGQRLSQQELKLGLLIKKLRSEKAAAVSNADAATSKLANLENKIANMSAELQLKTASITELEGMVEHFRLSAENANKMMDSQLQQSQDNLKNEESPELSVLVEEKFSVERSKWNIVEADLLSRINELEHEAEVKAEQLNRLNQSLKESQNVGRESREQVAELEEKMGSLMQLHSIQESKLNREISELKLSQEMFKNDMEALQARNKELEQKLEEKASFAPPEFAYNEMDVNSMNATTVGPAGPFGVFAYDDNSHTNVSHIDVPSHDNSPPGVSSHDYSHHDELHHSSSINDISHVDSYHEETHFGSHIGEDSREGIPDISLDATNADASFHSNLGDLSGVESRLASSHVGNDSLLGANTSIMKRMSLKLRKLENELSVSQKSVELAKQERDEFQAELEKMVVAQDAIAQSKEEVESLTKKNKTLEDNIKNLESQINDRNERIEELEQDVQDLKDMYREQVETLVNEIETLRK